MLIDYSIKYPTCDDWSVMISLKYPGSSTISFMSKLTKFNKYVDTLHYIAI